jgi:hypothetical protein
VSLKRKIFFGSNLNKPKQDLFRLCFGLFRETKKLKISVCFGLFQTYIETFETNRTVLKQTKTTLNFLKKTKQNMLSIKLFRLIFCLFRFIQTIGTLCFGIDAKQLRNQLFGNNRNNPKFSEKIGSLSNCFGCSSVCFVSIETSKLFQYRSDTTEIKFCFG